MNDPDPVGVDAEDEGPVLSQLEDAFAKGARVAYVAPSKEVEECLALMTDKRFRHLPVLDEGRVVGLVSIGDLVKAIIDKKQFMIEQLESYISGQ